jgi:putative membrane protein insertion efficiency factor
MTKAIRLYQHARAGKPSPCRYYPSCSTYAVESLQNHGPWHGSWLAVRRLCRCHPFGGHGFDPVPEKKVDARV